MLGVQVHTGLLIKRFGVQILGRAESWIEISAQPALLANSAMMSTLTVHCQWEDETMRERDGRPPSYAEAKKMKSLTFHTHGCPRASVRTDLLIQIIYNLLLICFFSYIQLFNIKGDYYIKILKLYHNDINLQAMRINGIGRIDSLSKPVLIASVGKSVKRV